MERLTHKAMHEAGYKANRNVMTWECIDKLGELEDKVEKGLLLPLPIALGAPCYVIDTCKCGTHWNKCKPDNIKLTNTKAKAAKYYKTYGLSHYCFKIYERPFAIRHLGYYGKRVFATFEEAEAAMQNMGAENE